MTTTQHQQQIKGYRTHLSYVRSYLRPSICVRARWAPVRRSRFSIDRRRTGSPEDPSPLCRIMCRVSSRLGSFGESSERYLEASMFSTYEPPELFLKGELAGWPHQLKHCEIVHPSILGTGSWEEPTRFDRFGGLERPRAARVGLVFPASLLPNCGTPAAV